VIHPGRPDGNKHPSKRNRAGLCKSEQHDFLRGFSV
jgi:hypothetical protein